MKNIISVMFAMSLIVLVGCGTPVPPDNNQNQNNNQNQQVNPPKKVEKALVRNLSAAAIKLVERDTQEAVTLQKDGKVELRLKASYDTQGAIPGRKTWLDVNPWYDREAFTPKKGENTINVPNMDISLPSVFDGGLRQYDLNPDTGKISSSDLNVVTLENHARGQLQVNGLCGSIGLVRVTKADASKNTFEAVYDHPASATRRARYEVFPTSQAPEMYRKNVAQYPNSYVVVIYVTNAEDNFKRERKGWCLLKPYNP